jgi:hypothetical protein
MIVKKKIKNIESGISGKTNILVIKEYKEILPVKNIMYGITNI